MLRYFYPEWAAKCIEAALPLDLIKAMIKNIDLSTKRDTADKPYPICPWCGKEYRNFPFEKDTQDLWCVEYDKPFFVKRKDSYLYSTYKKL